MSHESTVFYIIDLWCLEFFCSALCICMLACMFDSGDKKFKKTLMVTSVLQNARFESQQGVNLGQLLTDCN